MPRKSKAAQRRSASALKGWRTRRRNERERKSGPAKAKKKARVAAERKKSARSTCPRSRFMWAVTVAAPYFIRQKGKYKRHDSPDSAAYMVQGWYRTKKLAQRARTGLVRLAIRGRIWVVESNPRAYDLRITPDVEIKKVPYRTKLIGTIKEIDEH